ncbi:MAG: helix-turn-helix domain-containing protein [Bacteriovoracaceae bacterium]|nr:helix-turn-helix domain-containing protein [Bacteriovoracaceae bacterium]
MTTDTSQNNHSSGSVVHIGDHLKSKREEMKLSIEKVSQKTKINLNILRALEANNFSALPSPAYIKGFVLSYARVISLPPEDVITKLEYSYLTIVGKPFPNLNHTKQFDAPKPAEEIPAAPKVKEDPSKILDQDKKAQERQRVIVPAVVFVGVCVVFIGLYQLVTKTIDSEKDSVAEKKYGPTFVPSSELVDLNTNPKPEVKVEEEEKKEVTEEKKVEEEKVVEAKKEEVKPQEAEKPKPQEAEISARRNFPPKDFRKITVKLFAVMADAPENTDEKILPSGIKDSINKGLENVYVTAVEGSTWMSYKVDQAPIESVILEKGKGLFLQGKEILMFLGNVKVTRIFYQNKLIDAPTKTGFKSLIFPESQNSAHILPLFPKASDDILYTAEEYQRRMKIEEEELKAKKP